MTQPRPDFSRAGRVFAQEIAKHEKPKITGMEAFGWLVIEIILVLCGGVVFSILYNWFIPEIFTNTPELTVPQAMGIRLVAMFGTGNIKAGPSDPNEDRVKRFWYAVGVLLTAISLGFIIKQFM